VGIGGLEKKWRGAFIVGVHKKIVSLQNHFKFKFWLIIMICIIYLYHQKGSINKDDHVNFLIIGLQSKSLEGSMRDVNTKKWHYFMSLIRLWHSKWETIILQKNYSFTLHIGLYFNKTFTFCSIICCQPFFHLLVEGLNIHIHPSLGECMAWWLILSRCSTP